MSQTKLSIDRKITFCKYKEIWEVRFTFKMSSSSQLYFHTFLLIASESNDCTLANFLAKFLKFVYWQFSEG